MLYKKCNVCEKVNKVNALRCEKCDAFIANLPVLNNEEVENNPDNKAVDGIEYNEFINCPVCDKEYILKNSKKPRKCEICGYDELYKIPIQNKSKENVEIIIEKEKGGKTGVNKNCVTFRLERETTKEILKIECKKGIIGVNGDVHLEYFSKLRYISRQHIIFELKDNGLFISDLNSTNKTKINGRLMEPHKEYEVKNMDIISIAIHNFKILF